MIQTESGWTKGLPKVDGDYFCRLNEHDLCPVSFRLENGKIYEYGCGGNLYSQYVAKWDDYEYLGPFSASDAEQLVELRRVAEAVDQWFSKYLPEIPCTIPTGPITYQLRAALNPQPREGDAGSE